MWVLKDMKSEPHACRVPSARQDVEVFIHYAPQAVYSSGFRCNSESLIGFQLIELKKYRDRHMLQLSMDVCDLRPSLDRAVLASAQVCLLCGGWMLRPAVPLVTTWL